MMQMKLFELFDTEETLNKLLSIFGEKSVIKFSNEIIGITYDYGANSYIDVLKKVKELNLRQIINTSTMFINTIDYCVNNELFINKINFIYPIQPESTQYLDDYLEKINATTGTEKQENKLKLFKEIDWIISDECIDLQSISFQLVDEKSLYTDVQFFNNGVLLIDEESVISEVAELIKYIYL
ncbi:hypothetical protein [Priestia megaterium]|uniref:hypothetical protein n=1 Tax=Priestia megaterium TaxID=1404 RepID=UPI000BFD5686|nr:hypothetical protein [Priestia megaterium]PGT73599.1 hypothetical protein COD15_10350 [Priestia megaterium]